MKETWMICRGYSELQETQGQKDATGDMGAPGDGSVNAFCRADLAAMLIWQHRLECSPAGVTLRRSKRNL